MISFSRNPARETAQIGETVIRRIVVRRLRIVGGPERETK